MNDNYIDKNKNEPIYIPQEYRGKQKGSHNKLDFKTFKHNACTSLNEVECFLNNFNNLCKIMRLYKLLR